MPVCHAHTHKEYPWHTWHTAYKCQKFIICLFPAPIKSLTRSLLSELKVAQHALSPGWHVFQSLLSLLLLPLSVNKGHT